MFALILITAVQISPGVYEINSDVAGLFGRLDLCFEGRDDLLVNGQNWSGYFPAGRQVICLKLED